MRQGVRRGVYRSRGDVRRERMRRGAGTDRPRGQIALLGPSARSDDPFAEALYQPEEALEIDRLT
ncbi:hypothetical protein ASF18_02715 [Methylobacterium sp. Leaf89]|nr:hypothetical protein ASF18_02715 [Methylobacterium sp. Leaf89]